MSDKKGNSNRKILIVILLLIFVGAGILYYTINLDQGEFAEPMNEDELELLEDDVDEVDEDVQDDVVDSVNDDIEDDAVDDDAVDDDVADDVVDDDVADDFGDDIQDDIDDETTSSNGDELTDPTDPEVETSQITDQDISDDIDGEDQFKLDAEDAEDIEEIVQPDTEETVQTEADETVQPETNDIEQTDSEAPVTIDSDDPEDEELTTSDTIDEAQEETTEEEGIIDQIISFLSTPFRSDDSEEIAVEDVDDEDDIEDIDEVSEESIGQTDSDFQLESKNVVVLGIDDLSEDQDFTFDFIGLISFNADNLEIEFSIIPSRYTYEDQELRELSQDELITVITELTDLQIDYELVLDYSGFQYYVDEINGIELELPTDFIVPDLELELTQGDNQLDGTEALNYARFYNPDNGERSRINRQQEVIDKIFHKSLRLENILRLPGHYNHLINEKEAVETDIDQEMIRNTIRYIRQLDQLSIKYSIFSD